MSYLTRRQLLTVRMARVRVETPEIRPREEWAGDRSPKGPLDSEDVRFLIVHHSASHVGHTPAEAPAILRGFYDFHTSGRGWNDIAYNFLIDSEGGIWEGRAGSIDGPVAGDATGGNQGFTQLVCVIGDYNEAVPSSASLTSLVSVLAWLAERYEISTTPGSEVSFESRGSNLHPAGSVVRTPTITGHRTMSLTACPGDNLNAYVVNGLMGDVDAQRNAAKPVTTTSPPLTTSTLGVTTSIPSGDTTIDPSIVPASSTTFPVAVATAPNGSSTGIVAGAGAVVVLVIGAALWRYLRMRRD